MIFLRGSLQTQTFDSEYVTRLAARDPETERHFADYFGPLMLAKLRKHLRSPEAAEDGRQETLMRVLTTIRRDGGLRNPERLAAYVHGICKNVVHEFQRAQQRYLQADENAPEQADYRPDPESEFVSGERRRLVRAVLEDLKPKDRELLRAIVLEEREKAAVCREMGVDAGYLRVLLHRARGRFKAVLLEKRAAAG